MVVVTRAASVCLSVSKLVDGVCGRCALGSHAKNGRRAFVCGVAGVLLKGRAKNGRRAFGHKREWCAGAKRPLCVDNLDVWRAGKTVCFLELLVLHSSVTAEGCRQSTLYSG